MLLSYLALSKYGHLQPAHQEYLTPQLRHLQD